MRLKILLIILLLSISFGCNNESSKEKISDKEKDQAQIDRHEYLWRDFGDKKSTAVPMKDFP